MHRLGLLLALTLAAPALAEEREMCADRPGLTTAACTIEPGRIQAEIGLADWTLDRQADSRTDTILTGDALVRVGLGDHGELRIGWTAFGHERERDRINGGVERTSGTGDVTLGLKRNLISPDGSGTALALLPYVRLPVGRQPIGRGDWGAGLLAPIGVELNEGVELQLTPEVDAQVDEDAHGRHLAYGGAAALDFDLSESVTVSAEGQLIRDRDPAHHQTMALAAMTIAYQPRDTLQIDLGANAGLNRHTPELEIYFGVSRKF